MVDSLLRTQNKVAGAANLLVEVFRHDGDSLERGANRREDDVIRSDELSRSARRVLSFEALSFLNFKGRVGNAGNVDVVELRVRRLKRVNRLGLFENLAEPSALRRGKAPASSQPKATPWVTVSQIHEG